MALGPGRMVVNKVDTLYPSAELPIGPDSSWLSIECFVIRNVTKYKGVGTGNPPGGSDSHHSRFGGPGPMASWLPESHRSYLLSHMAQALPAQLPGPLQSVLGQEGAGARGRGEPVVQPPPLRPTSPQRRQKPWEGLSLSSQGWGQGAFPQGVAEITNPRK